MRRRGRSGGVWTMPEGLTPSEVGKEIAEHAKEARHAHDDEDVTEQAHRKRERRLSITEAVLLSAVALLAAWSGYSAAKWGTESSISLAKASSTRTKANRADLEGNQIRTLDSVSFNPAFEAYTAGDKNAFRVAEKRLRPGYRPAFRAWIATKPLTNRNAPPGPAYMPQYRIAQEAQSRALDAMADRHFEEGQAAGENADKYVRLTVLL